LLPLAVFFKESHCTKRKGHLFLKGKSAAFHSITNALIKIALRRIRVDSKFIRTYVNMLGRRESNIITAYGPSQPFKYVKGVPQDGVESPLKGNFAYYIGPARLKKENSPSISAIFTPSAATKMRK
jgi:Reverse transcriptase (RNA-dependent DNA polymerase)